MCKTASLVGQEFWIHGGHLDTPAYALSHLEPVLMHLRPAQLLVESRPEQLAAGIVADGPVEMAYASLLARAAGIPFDGMDWYQEAGSTLRRTDAERDDRMVENVVTRVAPTGTTLVLVGFSHVAEFLPRLAARGYEERPLSDADRTRLFDTSGTSELFPAGMAAAVERRIARDEAMLAEAPPDAERLNEAIAARRRLLERIQAVGER